MANLINHPAPGFNKSAVVDGNITQITLEQYKGKWVVLFFYPLDFTFVCPTEIIAFSENIAKFREMNCEVLACSVDSAYSHLAWVNTPRKQGGLGPMNIPIISDIDKKLSQEYNVLIPEAGIALRGLFIIDPKGMVRQVTVNDLPVGRSVDETIRLVKAYQFVEAHGEVCPANWHEGSETLKPTQAGISAYLAKH